jgi:phosphoribosylformylglycinamidine synthase
VAGETTDDMRLVFEQADGQKPLDLKLEYLFGKPPRTIITDKTCKNEFQSVEFDEEKLQEYLELVLQLESVACKDWLTNKVDRSITGKVARQQCVGEIQLPLSDVGVVALDYRGISGMATSIGHAPLAALIDPAAGSVLSIAESLTNIIWANLVDGLDGVSLSANWMWPGKNQGEDARLYKAVEACSDFACSLGINILQVKIAFHDSELRKRKGFRSWNSNLISAAGEVADIKKTVSPVLVNDTDSAIY